MIEKLWEILTTFTEESKLAVLSKCNELGFDPNRATVSLDESYINLNLASDILKDAIQKKKLIQLPITVQKVLLDSLEAIAKYQANLIAGTDEVQNLSDSIERLNTCIWQYGLHNLSEEVLGYQTKLNQLKDLKRAASETIKTLNEGISLKQTLEQNLEESNKQIESLQHVVENAESSLRAITQVQTQALDINQKATTSLTAIQQTEAATSLLNASSEKSNAEIISIEKTLNGLVSGFTTLKGELENNKTKQEKLFSEFEGYRSTVIDLLGDANRTGMAASFTSRRRWLIAPLIIWILIFAGSIWGLLYMGSTYLAPILDPKSSWTLEQLLARLALTAPFIWLGWFSAKQYGYTSRLREDYAYKEASAKSFEGYKREANLANPEMLKNLLDTAINNLGDNPIRIYKGGGNHASPLQEILENLLKNEKPADLLKKFFAKDKGKE
jgi:hypothetical protein